MPTDTFFKLPEEKRQRIIDAALREFATHTYHRASLSQVVEQAGIAKGSMYQYFQNKMDLYVYLIGLAAKAKSEVVDRAVSALGSEADLFDLLRTSVQAGTEFTRLNPRLVAVAFNLLRETDREVVDTVMEHFEETSNTLLGSWFRKATDLGQIDSRICPDTAQWVVTVLFEALSGLVAKGNLPLGEFQGLTTEVLDILENGLRPRDKTSH